MTWLEKKGEPLSFHKNQVKIKIYSCVFSTSFKFLNLTIKSVINFNFIFLYALR